MNEYVIPLTDFFWNRQDVFDIQDNHPDYKANPLWTKIGIDTPTDALMWDLMIHHSDLQKLEARFNCVTDSKFTKILAGGHMPAHIDPRRTAVVMFPLTEYPSPITYYENEKEIFTHHYDCVTIINATIQHAVPSNHRDRIFFQVKLDLPWEDVVSMHSEGTLYD